MADSLLLLRRGTWGTPHFHYILRIRQKLKHKLLEHGKKELLCCICLMLFPFHNPARGTDTMKRPAEELPLLLISFHSIWLFLNSLWILKLLFECYYILYYYKCILCLLNSRKVAHKKYILFQIIYNTYFFCGQSLHM